MKTLLIYLFRVVLTMVVALVTVSLQAAEQKAQLPNIVLVKFCF